MHTRGTLFVFLRAGVALLLLTLFPPPVPAKTPQSAQAPYRLTGTVMDATGAPVPGALVEAGERTTHADARGRFAVAASAAEVPLRVAAPGFAEYIGPGRTDRPNHVTLHPAGVTESVTVTAGRSASPLADTSRPATVLTSAALLTSGAAALDDAMRAVPGFSLFRRSSSRASNPTTQGASLRGLAASGASRALVLADGVPLNDPYGGWVYWDRIPQAAMDRVEVVRGGASETLYGAQAIGGVVQVLTFEPAAMTGRAAVEAGQHGQRRVSIYGGTRRDSWTGFAAGERFVLDGFPIVAEPERGPIDTPAGVKYSSLLLHGGWTSARWALSVRANWLDEDRANGTPLQRNDTNLASAAVSGRTPAGPTGLLTFSVTTGRTDYDQAFSAVAADRGSERLTARQRVASDHTGGSLQWAGGFARASVLLGADVQRISGGGTPADTGIQHDAALYSQVGWQPRERWHVVAGMRAGRWSTALEGATGVEERAWLVIPRVSATWARGTHVSLTASWSAPSRTPTLNELYRDFRVGSIYTRANPRLAPEDAHAFDAGVLVRAGRASGRLVGFWTTLDAAITNVTLSSADGQILRQRRNAGTIRARGLEAEGEWRAAAWASLTGSAAFLDSVFSTAVEPGLAGKRVSQVPRWQGTVSARFTPGPATLSVTWRNVGSQFDDDQNRFVLKRGQVLDVYAGLNAPRGVRPFLAIENVLDERLEAGRTPVLTLGTPRSARAGVRIFLP